MNTSLKNLMRNNFMFVKELFDKENITCPEWLSYNMIDDYWQDAEYSLEDNVHKWTFKDELRNVLITFDGERYTFGAYFEDIFEVLNIITEDSVMTT